METTTLKSPPEETEPDSPNPIQPAKPLSFSNGVLKLRTPHAPHAPSHDPHAPYSPNAYNEHLKYHAPSHAPRATGTYMECLKNHAAAIGGNAIDGCGEFMPSATSMLCAACGCHRNFHRLYPRASVATHAPPSHHLPLLEYRPHRRHRPSPPRLSPSPPPISSSHMLLSLSSPNPNNNNNIAANPNDGGNNNSSSNSKKRFRTRFTPNQKEKMYELAERLTWKMQRRDEEMISGYCEKIGVEKGVFKVWMHNNKNSRGKKETDSVVNGMFSKGNNGINLDDYRDNNNNNDSNSTDEVSGDHHVGTNGSSSCS